MRKITTKAVMKELLKFFSVFSLPKIIQTYHGSILSVFVRVLQQLCIQCNVSSAYHSESQGTLEWYHKTLRSMLLAFFLQSGRDWADNVPWLLFACREVKQELPGFSSADLLFTHTPQGLLAVLKDQFLSKLAENTIA